MIRQQRGFTIVELLIAMAIFSFMSVILSAGIIRLFQIYEAGASIRVSQQAGRTIAEQITRDAQSADTVVVGNDPSGTGRYTTICLLTNQIVNNTPTLSGPMYYVYDSTGGSYALTDQIGLWEKKVSLTSGDTQAQLEGQCTAPTNTTGAQQVSTNDTSVIVLTGKDFTENLLAAKLSIASNYDLNNIISPVVPAAGAQCSGGSGSRYCAITNLDITAGPTGGGGS
jgi:prepilin-type N-terminal cleavage/methylation domain-containing protein